MKIAIVGAGALGGFVGALLSGAGVDVTLYDIRKDYVEKVKKVGLKVSPAVGKSVDYTPTITANLDDIKDHDVVILATKAYHTRVALEGIKSIIKDDTLVCSFQNGYGNLPVFEEVIGKPERIIAVTTAHNFLVEDDTHIIYFAGAGGVDLGPMDGPVTEQIEELGKIFKSLKVPVKVHEKGHEVVWNKILWNAVLNCTAAVTGLDVITMANTDAMGPVFKDLAAEYFELSKAMGIEVWHQPNFIDLLMMGAKAAAKMKTVSPPKPSMLQDVMAKRVTEVDYINGAIVELGEKHGVPTPVNKTMLQLVKTIEAQYPQAEEE